MAHGWPPAPPRPSDARTKDRATFTLVMMATGTSAALPPPPPVYGLWGPTLAGPACVETLPEGSVVGL